MKNVVSDYEDNMNGNGFSHEVYPIFFCWLFGAEEVSSTWNLVFQLGSILTLLSKKQPKQLSSL